MPASFMFARFAAAVAIGFVGAYPFATASGLTRLSRDPYSNSTEGVVTLLAGLILFSLTLGFAGPTVRLIGRVAETLGRVEARPRPPVAFTMMAFGVGCVIAALVVQLNATESPQIGVTTSFNNGSQMVAATPGGSLVLGFLSILTFLLGASLIGLGIWSSVKPAPSPMTAPPIKPIVPEYESAMS